MPPSQELRELPVALISPNLSQPRRHFDESSLEELAGSVRERGVLQPVLVRPLENGSYGLVAGERRWRAARIAGLQTIPALISSYDDLEALAAALIENIARKDLNPVEEARAYVTLAQEFGLTQQQIGDLVGRSRAGIAHLTRILNLSDEILELLEHGELSGAHGRALLMAKNPESHQELAREAIEQEWSTRTLEARARESNLNEPESRDDHAEDPEQERDSEQAQDMTVMNIARVWGDALGAEVLVRTLPHHKLRVELLFDSPEGALAVGGRVGELVARGSRRR